MQNWGAQDVFKIAGSYSFHFGVLDLLLSYFEVPRWEQVKALLCALGPQLARSRVQHRGCPPFMPLDPDATEM